MAGKEVTILGAGVAGLSAAGELERRGNSVTILTPENAGRETYRSVYTTFQGATAHLVENFSEGTLVPLEYFRLVTDKTQVLLNAEGYFMVDYNRAVADLKRQLSKTRIEEFPRKIKDISISDLPEGVCVNIDGQDRLADAVIDCSGEEAVCQVPSF